MAPNANPTVNEPCGERRRQHPLDKPCERTSVSWDNGQRRRGRPIPSGTEVSLRIRDACCDQSATSGEADELAERRPLPGDVIVSVDQEPVKTPDQVNSLARKAGDQPLLLKVRRGPSALLIPIP